MAYVSNSATSRRGCSFSSAGVVLGLVVSRTGPNQWDMKCPLVWTGVVPLRSPLELGTHKFGEGVQRFQLIWRSLSYPFRWFWPPVL